MTALRARDGVEVARRQLDRARRNLELVQIRVDVGAAAGVDGKTAEVEHGRAEVALIQAERLERAEKLRLMEQLGVVMSDDLTLSSTFEVFDPEWSRDQLLEAALTRHPSLRAFEAQERASHAGTILLLSALAFPLYWTLVSSLSPRSSSPAGAVALAGSVHAGSTTEPSSASGLSGFPSATRSLWPGPRQGSALFWARSARTP